MAKKSIYKLIYLIAIPVVFGVESVYNLNKFYQNNDGMAMIGGIVCGLMFLIYAYELYEYIMNKKSINS